MTPRKQNQRTQPAAQTNTPDKLAISEVLAKLDRITDTIIETNDKVKKIEEDLIGIKVEVKKIGTLERGMNQMIDEMKHMDQKLEEVENRIEKLEADRDSSLDDNLWLEMKHKEKFLRFRKLPEQDNEDLMSRMVNALAEFLGKTNKEVEQEIENPLETKSSTNIMTEDSKWEG
uniref:Uncharacterized protein n=1 Tax=Sphaerodactylus townsendi TaxID=933632 RepID=A0ACB8FBG7_9SAUR